MRRLLILLAVLSCSCKDDVITEIYIDIDADCQRLIDDNYNRVNFPKDQCRCVYLVDGETDFTFSHKWSPYQYQRYLDSLKCGYNVHDYGVINVIKSDEIINGVTLNCDC